jgi:uncharacterized protein (DUF2235 family)
MPKNVVICADGTGNKFCDRNTNVVRLYSALDLRDERRQIAYYHGGLGTMASPAAFSQWSRRWSKVKGLAFGAGLSQAIGDAYTFLMENYEPDDRLFLFGFSRGAYTVRALSGMLHMLGLIRSGDDNLVGYALEMLKAEQNRQTFAIADEFRHTFSRDCKTYFAGVWDTVSSVGWVWDPLHVPYTYNNPDLSIGRHAISIDERRCFFRQNLWGPQKEGQSIKQVWFAGVHSDVGGGYPEAESGLSKIALEWMLCESCKAGLMADPVKVSELLGYTGSGHATPDASAKLHNSLSDAWMLLEPLPHRYVDMKYEPPRTRIRLPLGRRRYIAPEAVVHESVRQRPGYVPPNLPSKTEVEPWVRWNQSFGAGAGASR